MTRFLSLLLLVLSTAASALAAVKTEPVEYTAGDAKLQGFLAYADAAKPRPGVLIVPDWTGMSDSVKGRAQQLAELGYVAMVADIYGEGLLTKDAKESAAQAGKYKDDRELFRQRLKAGLEQLKSNKLVAEGKIAAMGYCFGGTGVLELGRSGANLRGIVTFHGGLDTPTPQDAKNIKCPVLVLHGADDPMVPPAQVAAFRKEMDEAGVKYEFIAYPGAVHAFTRKDAGNDNSKGAAYNEEADKKSWEEMKKFFARIFADS